jgi:hypothetical protein
MQRSGQFHAPAALAPGKRAAVLLLVEPHGHCGHCRENIFAVKGITSWMESCWCNDIRPWQLESLVIYRPWKLTAIEFAVSFRTHNYKNCSPGLKYLATSSSTRISFLLVTRTKEGKRDKGKYYEIENEDGETNERKKWKICWQFISQSFELN